MTESHPDNHSELDALLDREFRPLIERLSEDHHVAVTVVCVVEDTGVLSAVTTMKPHIAITSLNATLDALKRDQPRHDA